MQIKDKNLQIFPILRRIKEKYPRFVEKDPVL